MPGLRLRRLMLAATSGLVALGVVCSVGVGSAAAVDLFHGACVDRAKGTASNSAACTPQDGSDTISGPNGLLGKVTNIIALVTGIVAILFVLFGGFKYLTSSGESGKVQEAKNTIIYALVGLVVIVMARSIILFVLNKV